MPHPIASLNGLAGRIALHEWPCPPGIAPRGVVLIVHGLGEHARRYDALAAELNAWGYAVRGHDQTGHGESDGPRGGIATHSHLTDDLARVVDDTRSRHPHLPLTLLGHSLGGLVAADFVARGIRPIEQLVLSSPALDAGLSPVQKLLVATLPRLLPRLRVGNGLRVEALSHDRATVAAYRADPLVHDRVGARLAAYIAHTGPNVIAAAPRWHVPTLLMWAGDDQLVDPAGSRAFAQAAPAEVVSHRCFDGLYHEIFNEEPAPRRDVLAQLRHWLLQSR